MPANKIEPFQEDRDNGVNDRERHRKLRRSELLIKISMIPFSVVMGILAFIMFRLALTSSMLGIWSRFGVYLMIAFSRNATLMYPLLLWKFHKNQVGILTTVMAAGTLVETVCSLNMTLNADVELGVESFTYRMWKLGRTVLLWLPVITCVLIGGYYVKKKQQKSENDKFGVLMPMVSSVSSVGLALGLFTGDFFVEFNLGSMAAIGLIPWIFSVIWYRYKVNIIPRDNNDVNAWSIRYYMVYLVLLPSFVLQVLFFAGSTPTGAAVLFLQMLNAAQQSEYSFVLQLLIILAWNGLMSLIRKLAEYSGKYSFSNLDSLLVAVPVQWCDHFFSRSIFLSGMSITVLVVVVAFSTLKSLLRDSGVWHTIMRKILRKGRISAEDEMREWRQDQVWLETNWLNVVATLLLLVLAVIDRFVDIGGQRTLTLGLEDSHLMSILLALVPIVILTVITHWISYMFLYRRLRRMRAQPSAWHLNPIAIKYATEQTPIHDASDFWHRRYVFFLLVIAWGAIQGVIRAGSVRYTLNTGITVVF